MSQSCSCNDYYDDYKDQACEYTIPIKLIVPIFLEPKVLTQTTCFRDSVQIYLQPEIHLEPEVRSQPATCLPQDHYHQDVLTASES
jgi:hypothetical protein